VDVHAFTQPGAIADLHFAIGAFTGRDALVKWLPLRWQLHVIARRIDRYLQRIGADRMKRKVTFSLPDGRTYLITGAAGYPHAAPWYRTPTV